MKNNLDDCIYCSGSISRYKEKRRRHKDTKINRNREYSIYLYLTSVYINKMSY
jgi:hypothetical protein